MNPALILAFAALAILALVAWLGGRALSRRRAFACPACLVDNLAALRQYFSRE